MNNQHTFLHRNMLLLRACTESLSESDKIRLEVCFCKSRNAFQGARTRILYTMSRIAVPKLSFLAIVYVHLCEYR